MFHFYYATHTNDKAKPLTSGSPSGVLNTPWRVISMSQAWGRGAVMGDEKTKAIVSGAVMKDDNMVHIRKMLP